MFIDTFLLYLEYFKCHNKMSAIFDSKMIVEFIMGNVAHKNGDIINDTKFMCVFQPDVNQNISST